MKSIHRLTKAKAEAWLKAPAANDPQMKLADGGGLNLVRLPGGGATWQFRYRFAGVEKTYSIGLYHEVALDDARTEHRRVKDALKTGKDPVQLRRLERATEVASSGELFGNVCDSWLEKQKAEWGAYHYDKSKKALERHVLKKLGTLPFRDIPPALVADVVSTIERDAGRETAAKILRHVTAIFRYGMAKGLRDDNPAEAATEILGKPGKVKHRPAILTVDGVRGILPTLVKAELSAAVLMCHHLIAFTVVRISNAVAARWEEFDLDGGLWVIPRDKMKMQDREHDHKVVLAPALVRYLRAWRKAQGNPKEGWLFPGQQGREYIARETVEQVLLENGYRNKHTCHGWRASFSTLAKDNDFENQVVDLALDHIHDSEVARAYDRGERMAKRVKLMTWWGELLEG